MRAGRLRNPGKIQQNTPTRDTIGGKVPSWADFVASWPCELVQNAGGQIFRGHVVHAAADYVAVGRYVPGVTSKMRLVIGSRIFDIKNVNDLEGRTRELRLDVHERDV